MVKPTPTVSSGNSSGLLWTRTVKENNVTLTIQVPPPPTPEVYVVESTPWGYIVLAAFLFVLYLSGLLRRRGGPSNVAPGITLHGDPPKPLAGDPWASIPEGPATPEADYTQKKRDIENALKNFQMKPAEIKAAIQGLDLSLPTEILVMQVLKGGGPK